MKVLEALAALNGILWFAAFFGWIFMGGGVGPVSNSTNYLTAYVFLGGIIFTSINLMACMMIAILKLEKED
jgi:bacteriorhodopsin